MQFHHIPVLLAPTIEALNINPNGTYIDGTAGGGGHSSEIAKRLDCGRLMSIDQDPDAIKVATERLSVYPQAKVVQGNFSNMEVLAQENGITSVDGILLDIGVSSHQLDKGERGFSYHTDAPLDMRMSQNGTSASDLVNNLTWQEIATIISRYGEDKNAARIAKKIVKDREENGAITTTARLAELVKEAVPAAVRRQPGHPARKTFQAFRIEVNDELGKLKEGLDSAFNLLNVGGRLCVITFHSLEDRIVKEYMVKWATGCTCNKDFPICVCGKTPQGKIIYKKGIIANQEELEQNPRSRSARLRVIEKL
ncbi:MAG: 16S rRNA (cytosine(1402)-N(4))-methyltransferase RsmH [Clostridia bacterium]